MSQPQLEIATARRPGAGNGEGRHAPREFGRDGLMVATHQMKRKPLCLRRWLNGDSAGASWNDSQGTATIATIIIALGLAWLADTAGSAMIIGAFAGGVLLAQTPQAKEIEHGVASIGHFFVPLFFVIVGAAVDLRVLNPFNPDNLGTLAISSLLIVVAIVSKFAAGFSPFWFRGRKAVIGVGMIPRGEVGLIFAQMALSSGLLDPGCLAPLL
jgi:Kef-type K+ transport system membrane component KefB